MPLFHQRIIEKVKVPLYKRGWYRLPTHGRDPITAQYGCFWLLDFSPGPVHTSLDNLVTPQLPEGYHIDTELNADTHSTWCGLQQESPLQAVP